MENFHHKNLFHFCFLALFHYTVNKMNGFATSLATTLYPWSRSRPEVNFQKAALKGNGSHFFNFHFWIPGSLATTKYPWSRSRSEMNFQKASLKGNGSHFFNFHFWIPGSLATTKYPWSRNRPEVIFYKAGLKMNGAASFSATT